jgi:hypothetical protein
MSCASTTTLDVIWTPKPTALLLAPAPTLYWTGIPNVLVAGLFGATSSCALELQTHPLVRPAPAVAPGSTRISADRCPGSQDRSYICSAWRQSPPIFGTCDDYCHARPTEPPSKDKAAVLRVALEAERCLKSRFLPEVAMRLCQDSGRTAGGSVWWRQQVQVNVVAAVRLRGGSGRLGGRAWLNIIA